MGLPGTGPNLFDFKMVRLWKDDNKKIVLIGQSIWTILILKKNKKVVAFGCKYIEKAGA